MRVVVAEFRGNRGLGLPFIIGQTYPIAVKKRWFSRKVDVYKVRGYYNAAQEGTEHTFADAEAFDECWKIIKEVHDEE